ncbi:hypothetical protein MMC25_008367 [Agyrium rufum]|nr:hypothetical protein [Agyrium rufum]
MPRPSSLTILALAATALAQQPGAYTPEVHPLLPSQRCTIFGCKTVNTSVVLDAAYRWLHNVGGYDACAPNGFSPTYCPTVEACGKNCALEGVDYTGTGITTSGNALTLNLFTNNGTVASSPRVYLLQDENNYESFRLLGKEFTYDVDVSLVPCGVNGALYFSEMSADGDASKTNVAGAKYGTGYCDAQCPKNNFVNGKANLNSTFGACCNEMDIWEANNAANALTPHPCQGKGTIACTGAACGNDIATGTCDQAGCDFNPYRNGQHNFYGPGKTVDTTKKFTVVTQFITDTGLPSGKLTNIRRIYKQNGKVIQNTHGSVAGMTNYNSITENYCKAEAKTFNEGSGYVFDARGGLAQMGKALERGMVLVLSIWEDSGSFMQWLDGATGNTTIAGNLRGPCSATSGQPAEIMADYSNAKVTFSNIKFGDFGTTF